MRILLEFLRRKRYEVAPSKPQPKHWRHLNPPQHINKNSNVYVP